MQHMKNRHGLKKFKCNFCDYRSNDRKTLKGHENNKHNHELFKCLQYERKRHSPENRAFSAPLVRCSIAPVLLSLCRVAQLCRVARLCRFVFSAPLVRCSIAAVLLVCAVLLSLCNICAQETLSNEL